MYSTQVYNCQPREEGQGTAFTRQLAGGAATGSPVPADTKKGEVCASVYDGATPTNHKTHEKPEIVPQDIQFQQTNNGAQLKKIQQAYQSQQCSRSSPLHPSWVCPRVLQIEGVGRPRPARTSLLLFRPLRMWAGVGGNVVLEFKGTC